MKIGARWRQKLYKITFFKWQESIFPQICLCCRNVFRLHGIKNFAIIIKKEYGDRAISICFNAGPVLLEKPDYFHPIMA
ncbi:MAG: hypothetical protein A3K04_12605 [Gallionellales bacterium RBG_16_56_9]|nr:MAG: hypothetical protein A3K04_12605 [Gallionellales bacterium RBG_16_56_9]